MCLSASTSSVILAQCYGAKTTLASSSGALFLGKCAWYPLLEHALNFQAFWEFRISPCDVCSMMMSLCIRGRMIIVYAIMATCVEDFDHSISYALRRLGCAAMLLKPKQRAFVKSTYKGKDGFWLPLTRHCGLYAVGLSIGH